MANRSGYPFSELKELLPQRETSLFAQHWLSLNDSIEKRQVFEVEHIEEQYVGEDLPHLFEGRIFTELARVLPLDARLFVGNSMPVRDVDSFFPKMHKSLFMLANRGASGIDGIVSSALGACAGTSRKTVLVIGDVSFYHDLNGLLIAKQYQLDLTIILVHNDGEVYFPFYRKLHKKMFSHTLRHHMALNFNRSLRCMEAPIIRCILGQTSKSK